MRSRSQSTRYGAHSPFVGSRPTRYQRHWSELPRGGHYAALEVPEDVVADLRAFSAGM